MKKYALALSALALVVMSQSAMAAGTGTVSFTGSVTTKTCDLTPDVDGVTGVNNINLGATMINTSTAAKEVTLKQASTGNSDCAALTTANTALITWMGNLNSTGFGNQATGSDTASDAYVTLTPKNGKANTAIVQGSNSTEFAGNTINTAGAKYDAVLVGKTVAGKFSTVATFNVAYK